MDRPKWTTLMLTVVFGVQCADESHPEVGNAEGLDGNWHEVIIEILFEGTRPNLF